MTEIIDNLKDDLDLTDPYAIARFIKNAKKSTYVRVFIDGDLSCVNLSNIEYFNCQNLWILFGEWGDIKEILNSNSISKYKIECDRRNSAIPLTNIMEIQARIEPGAIIRDRVSIGKNAVIMMGAVINIGAEIGENSMIDMNAVIGARGIIGKNVHVGVGAVIAGVLEPPSSRPAIIEDGVLIGANSVVLEGIKVGKGSVVAAGSVVTKDVPENVVVAGSPARIVKSCVLLDKPSRRQVELAPDYCGFEIEDLFIVGYGLNYGDYYRNIPYVFTYVD